MSLYSLVASHTIVQGEQIKDGETIESAEGNFVLGFFSPPNSKNRYVGIWYKRVTNQTVVWVANRERPLIDSTGTLMINNDGNLVIMDWRGGLIMIAYGSVNGNTTAEFLENGNLVLTEGNNTANNKRILWQSFDYPTDSFLPGMKLGRNLNSKQNRLLTSWRSADDPAPGVYSFGADPNGTTQFFIWQEGIIYWTSGLFSGRSFVRVRETGIRSLFNYSFVRNDEEQYFTYSFYNKSIISRFVLQYSGQIQQLTWSVEAQTWTIFWTYPEDRCDVYAPCGAYGSCSTNTSSLCRCLQGFAPASPKDWESDNWSDGCRRQTEIKCGNNDAFLQFNTIKYPNHMQYIEGIGSNTGKCKSMCVSNCSCTAYSHVNETGCLFWGVNLMGLRENYNKTGQAAGDQEIFIRIAASDLVGGNTPLPIQEKKKRTWVIVVATVPPASLILGFIVYYIWKITRRPEGNTKRSQDRFALEYGTNISAAGKGNNAKMFNRDEKGLNLLLFSLSNVVSATDNFSPANKLGEGGFGPVYKGTLPEGQQIAIKRLSRSSGQGLEEFKNEIKLIAKLQHTNLVRLLGCCIEVEEKMLIYEYMVNGSLDSFIFDSNKRMKLDGRKRVHIIEGIAQGLLYLHKYSRLKIIHRDLKASNILLDGEMNPKISDFGMARIFSNNESEEKTRRIVGTYGYMSPEYAMNGKFSVKSDVFSFGVLLLEIISGTKNSSYDHLDSSSNILGYAYILWKDNKAVELVDPLLDESSPTNELVRYVHIALLCVQESASDRPTMLEVVSMLGNETTNLPTPKQPAFFIERNVVDGDSPSEGYGVICSANGLTVSLVEAR
ncbi:hypothetical protein AQUCO_00500616v1 [Aquilegia coerulea]|uniref:Receptor-like serine/threonine-protein kinase n=1 Tax=Aquilegia coerulea TaxID=218851 RepID=A0A2G5ET28_AQUCA|nr:hypothetical protein AQUCO_00500616v1 [Aquilegia coerulea]